MKHTITQHKLEGVAGLPFCLNCQHFVAVPPPPQGKVGSCPLCISGDLLPQSDAIAQGKIKVVA